MRIQPLIRVSRAAVFAILLFVSALPLVGANTSPIRLELNATQAPAGILHAHMTIPCHCRVTYARLPTVDSGRTPAKWSTRSSGPARIHGKWGTNQLATR